MSNDDQTPKIKQPETKASTSADDSKSTTVDSSIVRSSETNNLIRNPVTRLRCNISGRCRWILWGCIYISILWILSNINSSSLLSHRVRFYSIAISTLLSLEPPYNWNKIVSNFVWELVKPPGSVLWLGNTVNVPNSPNEQNDGKIAPSWKLLVYFSMRLLIDAVRISANVISDCCQLLITGLNYWFVQKESTLEVSQVIMFYGHAFYLIALVWTSINIIQTVCLIVKPSSTSTHQHPKYCLRCIVRFINLTMVEIQLLRIVLRSYSLM